MDVRRSRVPNATVRAKNRPRITIESRGGERTTFTERVPERRVQRERARDERDAFTRSQGLRLRRGLGNLGLTLLLPGSMQARAGNARVGRIAMRLWLGTWAAIVLWVLMAVFMRGAALALVANPVVATLVTGWLFAVGVGWCLLVLDAWRISSPPSMAQRHRLGFAALSGVLAFSLLGGLSASASAFHTQSDALASIFAGGGDTEQKAGRYNVLLMGADAGNGREGLRPDSLTVASIDAETGRTVLFGLPRNLQGLHFPADSPMRTLYPDGFECEADECLLNAVYTKATEAAEQDPNLYPDAADPGAEATREIIEETLGLPINYHVMIDLKGFEALIDAVGGITMDINRPVPVGGGSSTVGRYLGPGKDIHLDGRDALWFARSRAESSDYERMARQKCVMNAMLQQLDPMTVSTKFTDIAKAGKQIAETDIPPDQVATLMALAEKTRGTDVASVNFVPPLVQPGAADLGVIQQTVRDEIAKSEAADQPTPAPEGESGERDGADDPAGGAEPFGVTRPAALPVPAEGQPGDDQPDAPAPTAEDLEAICSAG